MNASPFATLSPEVRNKIYEDCLNDTHNTVWITNDQHSWEPALLKICTQIRSEARLVFYSQTSFVIEIHNHDVETGLAWLKTLDAKAGAAIASLEVRAVFHRGIEPHDDAENETSSGLLLQAAETTGINFDNMQVIDIEWG